MSDILNMSGDEDESDNGVLIFHMLINEPLTKLK